MDQEQQISKPALKLSEAFAKTDTISYGPFKVTKPQNQSMEHAKFYVDGHEITLSPTRKTVAAMLISLQGAFLTCGAYWDALNKTHFISATPNRAIQGIKEELGNQLVGVDKIDIDRIKKLKECFEPANPVYRYGETGPNLGQEMRGAYKISLDKL